MEGGLLIRVRFRKRVSIIVLTCTSYVWLMKQSFKCSGHSLHLSSLLLKLLFDSASTTWLGRLFVPCVYNTLTDKNVLILRRLLNLYSFVVVSSKINTVDIRFEELSSVYVIFTYLQFVSFNEVPSDSFSLQVLQSVCLCYTNTPLVILHMAPDTHFKPSTNLVAVRSTFSKTSISLQRYGDHA